MTISGYIQDNVGESSNRNSGSGVWQNNSNVFLLLMVMWVSSDSRATSVTAILVNTKADHWEANDNSTVVSG